MHDYIYALNNPINNFDFKGLCPEIIPAFSERGLMPRPGLPPGRAEFITACHLIDSYKEKKDGKCYEVCVYQCFKTWQWVAPESGKTYRGQALYQHKDRLEKSCFFCWGL